MSEVKKYRADWRHVVETEFDDAQYVGIADFDAQRLRADTAEAQLKLEREFNAVNVTEAERMLAAAEQRISELKAVLERMLEDDDMPVHWFIQRIDAALNPNLEAESQ